jgi:hypothetical protein
MADYTKSWTMVNSHGQYAQTAARRAPGTGDRRLPIDRGAFTHTDGILEIPRSARG